MLRAIYYRLGQPNFLRWLQWRDVFRLSNIEPGQVVVDLGCGTLGYALRLARVRDVKVVGVSTMNPPRRTRRVGRFAGKRAQVKKAVVRLADGSAIQLFPEA